MHDWIGIKIEVEVENEIETERCRLAVGVFSYISMLLECIFLQGLSSKGVDMDAKDKGGYIALHCATELGHADVIEMLVKKGADAEARTNKYVTALQIVESLHYIGITRILIHRGATKDNSNMAHILIHASVSFGKNLWD
ncbi:hypothetical protein C1H46_020276 [Malus baccata]|uniref:Uncharacterized protein n=1 Tax=Malus baccata TaxID=106549 RepID=A0A540M5R8_MALBA|nr:hypothetical protein C1H46_020276 [Malus baccata]